MLPVLNHNGPLGPKAAPKVIHLRGNARSRRTTGLRSSLAMAGALALVAGCGSDPVGDDPGGPILLQDENNYRATGSLSLPMVETAPGADLDICWTDVATDVQCHKVVPEDDLDNVGFLRFLHLTEAQVQTKLTSGELRQSEVDGYVEFRTDHVSTCTKLSQFSFFGTVLDVAAEYQETNDETYMLVFAKGTTPGVGARAMTFVKPKVSSTNTRVDAPSGCGLLSLAVDLTSPARVPVSASGRWIVDWRNVTVDGQGNDVIYSTIDKLMVGFYQGMTPADLQMRFFDIEVMATSLWDLPLTGGRKADLSKARNRASGATFDSFSHGKGTWVLGLSCTSCQNPAPIVLVVLEPKGGR
jgi:hypothetical protein